MRGTKGERLTKTETTGDNKKHVMRQRGREKEWHRVRERERE